FSFSSFRQGSKEILIICVKFVIDGQNSDDSKQSTADMTVFQSRFQTMSDSIITKNILSHVLS
ncbi:hypothetical protein Gogos_005701, partial [Gossypium gossypioides]|nr:hypothetical protein [Gossypium gossypioides]